MPSPYTCHCGRPAVSSRPDRWEWLCSEHATHAMRTPATVEAALKAREARQRGRARLWVLATLCLVVLLYTHHALSTPKVDRSWMGKRLAARP